MLCSASGVSPSQCGYEPPLFPILEEEVSIPSAQALICLCHRIWNGARQVLLQSSARTKRAADRQRTRLLPIGLGRRCGYLPRISPCEWNPTSWLPTFWVPSLSSRWSTQRLCVSGFASLYFSCGLGQTDGEFLGPGLKTPTSPPVHQWQSSVYGEAAPGVSSPWPWLLVPGGLGGIRS